MPRPPRIVMKFGGTSMAGIERIRHVASLVERERARGHQVLVVVSAMAGETDRLVRLCREAAVTYDPREYDVVVASGEQVTSGLLAITLQGMGVPTRSWMGWQLLKTDGAHTNARIDAIEGDRLDAALNAGEVAVVPGFQGITSEGRVATLGRGGSDTSAVAIAAGMRANRCDIYTDVEGVFTTDPRIVPRARKLPAVTYEEMLELASAGAKVLQVRSVGLAMRERLPLRVLSSFEDKPGTDVVSEEALKDYGVERLTVTGIAHDKNEARVTLHGLPDRPGAAAQVLAPLAAAAINVDMILQSPAGGAATGSADQRSADGGGRDAKTDLLFTVPATELARAVSLLEGARGDIGHERLSHDGEVAKISVVGAGMRTHPGVAALMFKTLGDRSIPIHAITTSEIRITALIPKDETELAVRVLHTAFGLDEVSA